MTRFCSLFSISLAYASRNTTKHKSFSFPCRNCCQPTVVNCIGFRLIIFELNCFFSPLIYYVYWAEYNMRLIAQLTKCWLVIYKIGVTSVDALVNKYLVLFKCYSVQVVQHRFLNIVEKYVNRAHDNNFFQ